MTQLANRPCATECGPTRVLIVHTHPVQYLAPLFARYAARPELSVHVVYGSTRGATPSLDEGFGIPIQWDVPLLEGYSSSILEPKWSGWRHPLRRARKTLLATIVGGDFDLVVAYGYRHRAAVASALLARLKGARWAFVTDSHTLESADGRVRLGKRVMLRILGRLSHAVVAQSQRSARFYEPFAPGRVFLVPHAIDEKRFARGASSESRDSVRRRHGARPADVVFLFAGKLTPNKRVADLLMAAQRHPGAHVWIVGAGPEESALRSLAPRLGDRVRFLGFVNQTAMPAIYSAADVVVLPSQHETFGLVVSEGAALGKPAVVSSACGVVDSLVIDRETGRVFPPGDVDLLSSAIAELLPSSTRNRMSEEMTRRFRDWTTDSNVQAFVDMCARVAHR